MSKKIITSAFSNLYTDQRIEKVCRTLHENGYQLELIGNDWGGKEEMQRPYPFSRIHLHSTSLKTAYFEFNWKLYHILKEKADRNTILHVNDVDAVLPNYLIAKKLNIPLVFDSHEIFTEMPAIQGKMSQKIWRVLERKTLPQFKFVMTESESYAEWFSEHYNMEKPIVVRNIPKRIDHIGDISQNEKKIILYQGAINPFRGLDQAIRAMHEIEDAELVIVGDGPLKETYEKLVEKENLQKKVRFLGKLHPSELRLVTKTADVGISLEENGGVSYLYSLPNKVSDYIQARVPLVMINFPEMKRVQKDFHVGEMITNHEPKTIATALKKVLSNGRNYYREELDRAANFLCWENEEQKIVQLFERAMATNTFA